MYKCGKTTAYRSTWEDEEDPRDKRQDSAVRPDVADVVEDEADEHEEEADQRERSGCLTIKVQNNSLKKDSFRCNISVVSSQLYGDVTGLSGGMWGGQSNSKWRWNRHFIAVCASAKFVRKWSTISELITLTQQSGSLLEWSLGAEVRRRTCEVNCLRKGNKYSGEEQGIINTRVRMTQPLLSGYILMDYLSEKKQSFSNKTPSAVDVI